jgi:hypothetical protein
MLTIFRIPTFILDKCQINFINFRSYNSLGGAVDIGALLLMKKMMSIGVGNSKYRNSIFYLQWCSRKLPLEIIAGVSQELENVPIRWHLTLENLQQWNGIFKSARTTSSFNGEPKKKVSFVNNALRHVIVGWSFSKAFNLRLGYNFRRAEELLEEQRNFSGISWVSDLN